MTVTAPPSDGQWAPALPSDLTDRALTVAMDVAARVREAERDDQSEAPLGGGGAGLALLYGQLDRAFPGEGWDVVAHDFLAWAVRQTERAEQEVVLSPGMLYGFGGLAYVARSLSKVGTRYGNLLAKLDAHVHRRVQAMRPPGHGVRVATFDVISGSAGTAAYLLDSETAGLRELLAGMVELCGERDGVQRWHTPHDLIVNPLTARAYPGGHLNCGLSHGSPGILAAMSLAATAGHEVPGQRAAMRGLVTWLLDNRIDDDCGPNWPTMVALPIGSSKGRAARTTWCYGAPGVARAMWLAGAALDDHGLRAFAVETMLAACTRLPHDDEVNGAGLCHGYAGVLQIALRFAHDTGNPSFNPHLEWITGQLLGHYRPTHRFGFRSLARNGSPGDDPGLLEGAAGVALALLATALPVTPTWDRSLALS